MIAHQKSDLDINCFGPGANQLLRTLYDSIDKPSVYNLFRFNDIATNVDILRDLSAKENDKFIR